MVHRHISIYGIMTEAGFTMIGCESEDGPNIETMSKFSWSITCVLMLNLLFTPPRSGSTLYSLLALYRHS
jgi:hypothetical protein